MKPNFEEWHDDLSEFDTAVNHRARLETITTIYLESDFANQRIERIKTMWLLRHLSRIL
jgi:hypothetical protein